MGSAFDQDVSATWASLNDGVVTDDSDNRPLVATIKNDPAAVKKAQAACKKANNDMLAAKASISRAEKTCKKVKTAENDLLLEKLDGWTDIVDAAIERSEDHLDSCFDWNRCDLKQMQQIQNADIAKIRKYMTAIKVLS